MGITLSSQATIFLFSMVLGCVLSLIFDMFRLTNAVFLQTLKKMFIKDIIYFTLSAIITFIFILIMNMGEIRIYIISGEIIGWIVYRLTIGSIIYKSLLIVIIYIKKILIRSKKCIVSKIPKKQINKLNEILNNFKRKVINKLKIEKVSRERNRIKNRKKKKCIEK